MDKITSSFLRSLIGKLFNRSKNKLRLFNIPIILVVLFSSSASFGINSASASANLQATAGRLTCWYEPQSFFDCVQVDPYTVRWNIIGNPSDQGNINGQFDVEYPGGLVYVTAHWDSPAWDSIDGWYTHPTGHFGILDLPSTYINDGGSGTGGSYPTGCIIRSMPHSKSGACRTPNPGHAAH
jgi:hypothetical protein